MSVPAEGNKHRRGGFDGIVDGWGRDDAALLALRIASVEEWAREHGGTLMTAEQRIITAMNERLTKLRATP